LSAVSDHFHSTLCQAAPLCEGMVEGASALLFTWPRLALHPWSGMQCLARCWIGCTTSFFLMCSPSQCAASVPSLVLFGTRTPFLSLLGFGLLLILSECIGCPVQTLCQPVSALRSEAQLLGSHWGKILSSATAQLSEPGINVRETTQSPAFYIVMSTSPGIHLYIYQTVGLWAGQLPLTTILARGDRILWAMPQFVYNKNAALLRIIRKYMYIYIFNCNLNEYKMTI